MAGWDGGSCRFHLEEKAGEGRGELFVTPPSPPPLQCTAKKIFGRGGGVGGIKCHKILWIFQEHFLYYVNYLSPSAPHVAWRGACVFVVCVLVTRDRGKSVSHVLCVQIGFENCLLKPVEMWRLRIGRGGMVICKGVERSHQNMLPGTGTYMN